MNYNLTGDLYLSCLLGSGELQLIGFSLHEIFLYLQNGVRFQILCPCEIVNSSGVNWRWEPETGSDMTGFYSILHSEISGFEITPQVSLKIAFSNGSALTIYVEHDERYESFLIREPDSSFIVV